MARLAWAVGFEPPRPDGRKEQRLSRFLAGAAGFEPANAGIKSRCLTTWRRPSRSAACAGEEAHIATPGAMPARRSGVGNPPVHQVLIVFRQLAGQLSDF